MTYSGIFEEYDLKKAKKEIRKLKSIIAALEKEIEQKENEIRIIKNNA